MLDFTAYTWTDIGHYDVFAPMVRLEHGLTHAQNLAIAVPKLLAQPPGKRCVMLWHAASDLLNGREDPTKLLDTWPNPKPYRAWLAKMFDGLIAAGVTVDRVVVDFEEGFNSWHLDNAYGPDGRIAWFASLWANSAAFNRLPDYIRARPLSAYQAGYFDPAALIDWGRFADGERSRALREAITCTAHHSFGPQVPVSNYGDSYGRFPTFDQNNWPNLDGGMGTDGSPCCYLKDYGHRYYNTPDWMKHRRLPDCINYIRTQTVPCTPWVTAVDAPFSVTESLLRVAYASGTRTFIVWFWDGTPAATHQATAAMFRDLPYPKEIPSDVEIMTI